MIRSLCLVVFISIFIPNVPVIAQEWQEVSRERVSPEFRRRALVMDISAKVIEDEQVVVWSESVRRIAIPGSPISIRLVGSNIAVVAQFTPFIRRREGNVLVAQGQIWIVDPGSREVTYHTSIRTIPMDLNEPIYFFPLGTSNSSIEIMLIVSPYREAAVTENDN
jgi:hypothetical protein